MEFEWDDAKAAANLAKHGVVFPYAARVFLDPYRLEEGDADQNHSEARYRTIGSVDNRVLVVIYSHRQATYASSPQEERPAMSASGTTNYKLDPTHPPRLTEAQAARLDAMTDEEIQAQATSDPDAGPVSPTELERFRRVPDVRAIRQKLALTQQQFADVFHLSVSVIRDWEQRRSQPDQAARALLRVIAKEPEVVSRALKDD